MTISLTELGARQGPFRATVHSFERSLYQVTVCVDGREHLLLEESGRTFRRRSINAVREALAEVALEELVLRQESAYDEMIGQPVRQQDNALVVPLAPRNGVAPARRQ